MTQMPPYPPTGADRMVRPHRGGMLLAFGILSLLICFIFGIVAWVMANGDLKAMAEGQMDRSGEGLTKAGKILGIVGVAINIAWLVIVTLMIAAAIAAGVAGAASKGAGGP